MSIRLSQETDQHVRAEALRTRRSRGAVVEALTEEALRGRMFPGIVFTGPESDRRASVAASGFDVWQVVQGLRDFGSIEAMVDQLTLSERQIEIALGYAERYPQEIEDSLARNVRPLDELRRDFPFAKFVEHDSG